MAFEKSKVLKAAEKFLSQGNIKAAIKEYRQIVDNDDEDLTALNMLGDLQARAGDKEGAVECFTRIAEHIELPRLSRIEKNKDTKLQDCCFVSLSLVRSA